MKSTMSFHWKSLISKIHRPLPMSPRESARLLALLDTSFKHQLNRQHQAGLPDSEHHTDLHLHSILSNPLFGTKHNSRGMRSKGKTFGQVQELVKRPMEVFREQVAAGTATTSSAGLCLQAQYNSCMSSPESSLANAMRASRAGTTVLEWLWSAGTEKSKQFFDSQASLGLLLPFLVAEGQHARVSGWLRRLHEEINIDKSPENFRRHRILLLEFVKAEISLGCGLTSATRFFVQLARDALESDPKLEESKRAFYPVALYLTTKLINLPKTADLQASTLEPLMDVSNSFDKSIRGSCLAALHGVHLAMAPDPKPALEYLQRLSPESISKLDASRRPVVVLLGLKTAELLLDRGCQADAIHVMDFLQLHFDNEIGSYNPSTHKEKTRRFSHEAEGQTLRLLDSLATA